jgi:hypothetical protein
MRCSVGCGCGVGSISIIGVVAHVEIVEEVVDIREEIIILELIAERRRIASSRVQALRKNLIAPHTYMSTRGRVLEAYCPVGWCMPKDGMRNTKIAAHGFGKKRSHMCLVHAARVYIQVYIVLFGKVPGSHIQFCTATSSARRDYRNRWHGEAGGGAREGSSLFSLTYND